MRIEDEILVKEYRSGNKEALTILVKKWHIIFCKKALWILKDPHLSKDVAQETWQVVIAKIEDLKDPASFGSWALRIVYSKSLDMLRVKARAKILERQKQTAELPQEEDRNEDSQLKAVLLKAILNLPLQQQNVITLFYNQEYSLKEISELLDISVGTVKSRLFHAREKLKKLLKHKHYEN
ncbi:RNA polymerase sigma-70 factor, ECF subfamily [Formosa sp. Hel1_31_208]|uniref:RNA polymerase sigma factor n=1 Tax=Formosa sp. Hel1_31_208 TaxID=1798225 RepID=UPI00087CED70|nr:sigma-70 family RNA polymerase sigma factor [Formosa sp. Hel1_31_208]SDS26894.1 RNA polymerase sigma-70 factor, ECF subfamily [Formosa sp. Hel1_31_208]